MSGKLEIGTVVREPPIRKPVDFQVVSDLHLESRGRFGNQTDYVLGPILDSRDSCENLIIAGDLCTVFKPDVYRDVLTRLCSEYKNVVYVLGNHCYYKSNRHKTVTVMRAIEDVLDNLYWLDCEDITIDGAKIFGDTFWFPRTLKGESMQDDFSDFRFIEGAKDFIYEHHDTAVRGLKSRAGKVDIVVTHHGPSLKSIHPKFYHYDSNMFFCNNYEDLIREVNPKVWVHGHVHSNWSYFVGQTNVVVNPYGYPGENPDFDPGFKVTV